MMLDVRCVGAHTNSHCDLMRPFEAHHVIARVAQVYFCQQVIRENCYTRPRMGLEWKCVDTSGFFSEPIYCAITQMKFQRKHVQISCAFFPSAVSFCSKGIRNCLLLGKQINANAFHSCLQSVTIIMFECIYRLRVWNVSPAEISKHWHYGIWVTGRKHIDEKKIWS